MKENSKKEYLINKGKKDKKTNKEQGEYKNEAEIIVEMILNKIFLNSVYEVKSKEINEKMKLLCYDFLNTNINAMIKTKFFVYDNALELNKDKIFYDYHQKKFDEELLILPEPITPGRDRNDSSMIKLKKETIFSSNKNIKQINNKNKSLNELIEIEGLSKITNENKEMNEDSSKSLKTENAHLLSNKNNNYEDSTNLINENTIISLPCEDLEEEKYMNIYTEQNNSREFNILRLDYERELRKKKREKEKKVNIKKIIKDKKIITPKTSEPKKQNKIIQEFDSNKLTFDSKGNIIKKTLISTDSFAKDFSFLRLIINKGKIKKNLNHNIIKIPKENKLLGTRYKRLSEDISKITLETKETLTERSANINKIEYNPKDKEELYKYSKYAKIKEEDKNVFLYNYCIKNLNPEPGVVLKSKVIKKLGGKNFFRKYNRPSMKEFNNFISNISRSKQNSIHDVVKSTENTNNILNSNEKTNEENDNVKYNGYKQMFEENNPLIKDAKEMSSTKEKKYKKIVIPIINNIKKENWRINKFSDSLVLSDNTQLSSSNGNFDNLYNYLSEKNLYKDFDFVSQTSNHVKENYKTTPENNILKNMFTERIKHKKFRFPKIIDKNVGKSGVKNNNLMENFNKKIINDINYDVWGTNSENMLFQNKSEIYNNIKPFSLFKKLNVSKLGNKRERKNMFDIIKKSNELKFKKLYNLDLSEKDFLSE